MHRKHVIITLDGIEHKVPKFTIGEHEAVADIFQGPAKSIAAGVLGLALSIAVPPVQDVKSLRVGFKEIQAAVAAVLKFNDYQDADPNA